MRLFAVSTAASLIAGLLIDHMALLACRIGRLLAAYDVDDPSRPWWTP